VPVLKAEFLEVQLANSSSTFLKKQCTVDFTRRIITLPKICDVYRNDFGDGDPHCCAEFCAQFLEEKERGNALELLNSFPSSVAFRYKGICDNFHSSLKLMPYISVEETFSHK